MINTIGIKKFCCEDLSLIENYEAAINDTSQTWDCHHRNEIELNLSSQELKKQNLYYNRPASELIFLTHSEHSSLHSTIRWKDVICRTQLLKSLIEANKSIETRKKKSDGKKGKQNSETHNKNISKAKKKLYLDPINRQMQSDALKGKHKNRRHMTNGVNKVFVKSDEIDYYLERGYHFGRK